MLSFDPDMTWDWTSRRHAQTLLNQWLGQGSSARGLANGQAVLDSNAIAADLLHSARSDWKRPVLLDLIDTGHVEAHITGYTAREMMTRALPKMAKRHRMQASDFEASWTQYQSRLRIHTDFDEARVGLPPRTDVSDPDDWPVADLADSLPNALIITGDTDFRGMGERCMSPTDFRNAAIDFANREAHATTVKMMAATAARFGLQIPTEAISATLLHLSPEMKRNFLIGGAAAMVAALLIPATRQKAKALAVTAGKSALRQAERWAVTETDRLAAHRKIIRGNGTNGPLTAAAYGFPGDASCALR